MGLCVTFVGGIRRSGKSTIIQAMVDRLWKNPPHYIRLAKAGSSKTAAKAKAAPARALPECNVASARWIDFTEDRLFEILPEALTAIYRDDRYGSVVIEADSESGLRCAYPYDHRVFVMPRPTAMGEVFRDPQQAARELKHALDDTAAFASEIFGLFPPTQEEREPKEDRPELSGTNMRGFLYSPLGDELVTRIQLQQPYHGMVESDVIVVNTNMGRATPESDECVRRIDGLLARVRSLTDRRGEVFFCDPQDESSKDYPRLLEALQPMCLGGK